MSTINGWWIVVGVFVAYGVAVYLLYRFRFIGPDRALSLFGPALMIKTRRGRGFLERVGRFKRLWSVVGDIAIVLATLSMVTIVALLALEAILISKVPAAEAPSPQTAIGLPGINPFIPVTYGIIALVVGVVLHEMFHGVMARSQDIRVKTIGILWFVVPIGAFVEQDDTDMTAAPRRSRDRVVAAGVLANFFLAIVFFTASSAVLTTGIAPNAVGVGIGGVLQGYPAYNASMHPGDILVSVNGTSTADNAQLLDVLVLTHPKQNVSLTYFSAGQDRMISAQVVLGSLGAYNHNASENDRGFLGVQVTPVTPGELSTILASPWNAPGGPVVGLAEWIILPLLELQPVAGTTTTFYHAIGPLSGLGVGNMWIAVNVLYWLAWMNLLLGLSNSLPIIPFDGGLLFRDLAAGATGRLRRGWDPARVERAASSAVYVASIAVVFLLVWLLFGPRL
ncbi:MAG: site-2 protease family protein [Thermoplasmata archaeon]|nr:site-2 protease family protein [Thermoplasmata archaeon]